MNTRWQEWMAVGITLLILLGLPVLIFQKEPTVDGDGSRMIRLTGLKEGGVWTPENVNGLTYWWKTFRPADVVLGKGEEVILLLSSADVTHEFYLPELGVGPVAVEPGHTVTVRVKADSVGTFTYYCTRVCGECHYWMRGEVKVVDPRTVPAGGWGEPEDRCILPEPPAPPSSIVDLGQYLYNRKGCVTCHGTGGTGGVYNPNYTGKFIPRLNTLAEKMKVYWKEDADSLIRMLGEGKDLDSLAGDPPFRGYERFLAQYHSVRDKIRTGSPELQWIDPEGPAPPLTMPSWEKELSPDEIDAIIAYLLTRFPWEDYGY